MARTINFVRERRKQLQYVIERDKLVLQRTLIVFALVILMTVASFVVNWWSGRGLKDVIKQQQATKDSIQAQSSRELQYNIFVEKLKALTNYHAQRQGKKDALTFFRNLFTDEDVKISGLEFGETDQKISFSIWSRSVFSLDKVMNVLKSKQLTDKFPNIKKDSIKRSSEGPYTVKIEVDLKSSKTQSSAKNQAKGNGS